MNAPQAPDATRRRLALGTAGGLVLGLLPGCAREVPPTYRFESAPRIVVPPSLGPTRFAKVALDPVASSTAYLLTVAGDDEHGRLVLLRSEDGGDSFGDPVPVSDPARPVSAHGENAPTLVLGPAMLAAWNEDGDIRCARSASLGASFESPVRIRDAGAAGFAGYLSLAQAPWGDVYAVWLDQRGNGDGVDTLDVYVARSTDGAASFGANVLVARGACPCCRPGVGFGPDGEVLVFHRFVYPGDVRDMTVAVGRDRGAAFAPGRRISDENWRIDGCPDSGVALARRGRRLHAAWLSEATPARTGVLMSWTDDGGATWAPALKASQGVVDANYPAFASAADGRIALVFQGRDPRQGDGWGAIRPFVLEVDEAGRCSPPQAVPTLPGSAMRPALALGSGGRLFAAWTSMQQGAPRTLLARARRIGPA